MFSSAELYTAYQIANAPVRSFPYPHCFVPNVFPADFYSEIQRNLPDASAMVPIEEARKVRGYKERFVLELHKPDHLATLPKPKQEFWQNLAGWMTGGPARRLGSLGQLMLSKFQPFVQNRLKNLNDFAFYDEAFLVEDVTNYALGPHSDSPRKVITMLFYLPKDESQSHLGTSIYIAKDPNFRCPGGPHYPFEPFERVVTMPFLPNSLFTFVKTDNSFHGVEPVRDADCKRWLLLFDVFMEQVPVQPQPVWRASVQLAPGLAPAPASAPLGQGPTPSQGPGLKFTF